jgi:Zn-finger nucleic acid-binding protein
MTTGDITVDICKGGCGGIWFDRFELAKVDEPHESAGEALLDIEKNDKIIVEHSKRRRCPKCNAIIMMRHFHSVNQRVEVDECPGCAGYWLDVGELSAIRSEFKTEEERRRAAEEYFAEIFNTHLAGMRAKGQDQAERARNIARIFRFICPSYYLPGKQDWGAY